MEDPLEYPPFVQKIEELARAAGVDAKNLFACFSDPPCEGLEISDTDEEGGLAFDLVDLLEVIGEETVLGWHWICQDVECSGPGADALHAADDDELVLSGETLFDLATQVDQTVKGLFLALPPSEARPILALRAVDSAWWEVWTQDDEIHDVMLGRFETAQFI
jgi:hypothetical protein